MIERNCTKYNTEKWSIKLVCRVGYIRLQLPFVKRGASFLMLRHRYFSV